jgi:hypothetical protein
MAFHAAAICYVGSSFSPNATIDSGPGRWVLALFVSVAYFKKYPLLSIILFADCRIISGWD